MSETTTAPAAGTAEAPAAETGHGETPAAEAGHSEGTAAEGGHGGGVFPPLDTSTFPSQIFWLVIFFALLYFMMSKVALPRLGRIFETRMGRINGDLTRAQALKEETEAAIASYEKALADARAKAQGIAAETKAKMQAEMDAERSALEATLSKKVAEAEASIAKARAKAMEDVAGVAADTAAEIVAELTGTKVTKAAASKAIADLKG
jgi:F-type H+-transporting ATPase subunit b